MATLKSTQADTGGVPRYVHAGVNGVVARYQLTATTSVGDVIQMVKIPNGAEIIDMTLTGSGGLVSVGDGGDTARYISTATASAGAVVRMTKGLGYTYDISDDAADQFDTIDIRAGDALFSSATITLTVTYLVGD